VNRKNFHKIILASPALAWAIALRAFNLIGNGAFGILLVLDIVGTIGGVYWLHESRKLSDKIYDKIFKEDVK